MKSKGKKFLSALLVSSMVLTSSLGFMPRTAQAAVNSGVYSYDFEYTNTTTETGNRKIVLNFEKDLTRIDSTKISIVGDSTATVGLVDPKYSEDKVSIVIEGVDPSQLDYTLKIESGAFEFSNYQQIEELVIPFKSYDITPGFKSIFKDPEKANKLLDENGSDNIILHVDSDYITNIEAKHAADTELTEISISTTDEVGSVLISIDDATGDGTRVVKKGSDGKFSGTFSGLTGSHSVDVISYGIDGEKLKKDSIINNFDTSDGTNFKSEDVHTFEADGYKVSDILAGTVLMKTIVAGKTYTELDQIGVQYAKTDNIFRVSSASELAGALSSISSLSNKKSTIYLESDITLGSEVIFKSNAGLLTVKGNGHTITGDVELGDPTFNDDVRFINATVTGNVDVNVGSSADAYLTDLSIGGDLVVTSGDYTSVYLTRVTANLMKVNNSQPVHIVAYTGTTIGSTELTGSKTVKLTMAGGTFGSNILHKMTGEKLVLEGDKTKNYDFEKLTIDAAATAPEVQLLENTKVLNLVANKAVTMTGHNTSVVVKSSESTEKITYSKFLIEDATSDTEKYAGTDVPDNSGTITPDLNIPTTNSNKIKLTGNMIDGLTATAVNAGTGYVTLTLDGNLNWAEGITSTQLAGINLITEDVTGSTPGSDYLIEAGDFTVNRLSDKVLKLTFDPSADIADGDQIIVTFDLTKFVVANRATYFVPDQSVLGTNDWAKADEGNKFDTLYRPSIQGTDDFIVYANAELGDADLDINVGVSSVVVSGITEADYQFKTNFGEWAVIPAGGDISTEFTGIGDSEVRILEIKPLGGDESTIKSYPIKKNEPWFSAAATDQDVSDAIINEDVSLIHLFGGTYDLSGADAFTAADYAKLENKASSSAGFIMKQEDNTAVNITLPAGADISYIQPIGTVNLTGDTTKPTVTTVVGTTVAAASDTIVLTFSENMNQASVEELDNWIFNLDTNSTTGGGVALDETDASIVYDEATKKATITLKDVEASALFNGRYVGVVPTANVEDLIGNAMLTTEIYGDTPAVISGETTAPQITSVTAADADTDGFINTVTVVFDEDMRQTTTADNFATLALTDADSSTNLLTGLDENNLSWTDAKTLVITLADTSGTTGKPELVYTADGTKDFTDLAGVSLATVTPTVTDAAASVVKSDAGTIGTALSTEVIDGETIVITFSEVLSGTAKTALISELEIAFDAVKGSTGWAHGTYSSNVNGSIAIADASGLSVVTIQAANAAGVTITDLPTSGVITVTAANATDLDGNVPTADLTVDLTD